ncbi:YjfK family protein [Pseudomonas alliivorans]|uniref:YjfK family protein n=1 Tax=Pseudomonas alliivorans TaxID=2810613 RepID=A0ABS4C0P2_9PSED|nr:MULTISPECIES: YjfK family protein [Pseudomonas]MBP0938589.1 YjfK family protein [Pseudomonas alliivorans]MBP0944184.1 YjfK family protein [Pseudomonas alliivorans]MCO5364905.1 YjfK family protein [Pseudomonas alliivorans]MEE4307485.1 YjfK family protein [Pseudomonas alliivorans]MEE4325523.1 YjfK family protein [Pseudomonas alliivorans]
MSWFKRAMGLEAPKTTASANGSTGFSSPLGLASGRMLCLDSSLKMLLDGHSYVVIPGDEKVWSVGRIDLGQSMALQRFYLDNEDYFLQVVTNGPAPEDIQDIILFGYYSASPITSKDELLRLTGPASKIGLPTYEHEGEVFERQWGTETGQTELTPLDEDVVSPDGAYRVKHLSMLYARETGLINRREFLLFSVEEDEEGEITLTTAVGVTLQSTDINVL